MNNRVNLEPGPRWSDLCAGAAPATVDNGSIFTGSGKAGLALILGRLRERGVLEDKMAEVLVPSWLGAQVYHTISNWAFPTLVLTPRTRAVLVYHQYGFPQNMDNIRAAAKAKNLVVIEDCAHAAGTPSVGKSGEYALFSYSKFAFCRALGAVRSSDPGFAAFAADKIAKSSCVLRLAINAFKTLDEANRSLERPAFSCFFDSLRLAAYALYGRSLAASSGAIALWNGKGAAELDARARNYHRLLDGLAGTGLTDHLERDGVAPYAVPLRPPKRGGAAAAELAALGIESGLYQFDYARNVFEPAYAPCLLLPCHSGLTGDDMAKLAEIVRKHHS